MMAIIGFILVIGVSIYCIACGCFLFMFTCVFNGKEGYIISTIIVLVGLSLGYLGIINAPFEVHLK
jgi:hypothetical protein